MKTHRCKDSLEARVSIRYGKRFDWDDESTNYWRLYKNGWDSEWGSYYMEHIAVISYCPFCGEKLKEGE